MRLAGVKADDVVYCDVRGLRFWAQVEEREGQRLGVVPLDSRITYRQVSSRQIVGHWRKARNGSGPAR